MFLFGNVEMQAATGAVRCNRIGKRKKALAVAASAWIASDVLETQRQRRADLARAPDRGEVEAPNAVEKP